MSAGTKICPQCSTEYPQDQSFCPKDGSTLRSVNAGGDLVGSIIADRYRITKKLGEGGMGAVYRGEQMSLKRSVAVKLLKPELGANQQILRRFNAEAEAMQQRAEAFSHYNEAAVLELFVKVLPDVARELASPMASIDSLTVLSTDGAAALPRQVTDTLAQTLQMLKGATGVDLQQLVSNATAASSAGAAVPAQPVGPAVD